MDHLLKREPTGTLEDTLFSHEQEEITLPLNRITFGFSKLRLCQTGVRCIHVVLNLLLGGLDASI